VLAAWYDQQGDPGRVLQVGEIPVVEPAPGQVRVRLTRSGINPGDVKKRQAWLGNPMAFARIIPHSDGVDPSRLGRRVWVYGAQSYRPFGTAAQTTVVPDRLAVDLPDAVSDGVGACLGIPGITAHRAVFADGPVAGKVVVVHGVLGSVGSLAAALAKWGGATVVGTVRNQSDVDRVAAGSVDRVVALEGDPVAAVQDLAPGGVDRVVEVAFSANIELNAQIVTNGAVIAAYASPDANPTLPFWPLLFNNVTVRLLGSDDFPVAAKDGAARDLSIAAAKGALPISIAATLPLGDVARAHELVEDGHPAGRVLLALPEAGV